MRREYWRKESCSMSVLKSRREQSEMQFFQTAVDIQNELIKFCMEEKNVPKKYRFVYAIPIIAEGQRLYEAQTVMAYCSMNYSLNSWKGKEEKKYEDQI